MSDHVDEETGGRGAGGMQSAKPDGNGCSHVDGETSGGGGISRSQRVENVDGHTSEGNKFSNL